MSVRVAINGFGRIGRVFLRAVADREAPVEVVAVNDVGDPAMMGTLLRHDSVFGPYPQAVAVSDGLLFRRPRPGTPRACRRRGGERTAQDPSST